MFLAASSVVHQHADVYGREGLYDVPLLVEHAESIAQGTVRAVGEIPVPASQGMQCTLAHHLWCSSKAAQWPPDFALGPGSHFLVFGSASFPAGPTVRELRQLLV